jgi:murein DD-endopeptidase MepM/ murein hydrolase activator NlpD
MNISLTRPLPDGVGEVSQWFGQHPDWYKVFDMVGHNGIDYAVPEDTPVLATHAGRVIASNDPGGYGFYLIVKGAEYQTIYAHLRSVIVVTGQDVIAGEQIAWSGNTGNSTGPHLHFGLKVIGMRNPGYSHYIDPAPFRDI